MFNPDPVYNPLQRKVRKHLQNIRTSLQDHFLPSTGKAPASDKSRYATILLHHIPHTSLKTP